MAALPIIPEVGMNFLISNGIATEHIPEALATSCQKCSEKHKNGIRRVVKHLSENKKDWWNELVVKYDPDGVYRKKYEELSKTEGLPAYWTIRSYWTGTEQ
ncbi:hypothetical protein NQ318_003936 [Aromia moschata]|uniref:Uncharacterized protein n=1 Tax=Aromia moschata TaxID=1265417 RepID=A0AAV8Z7X4_9CUCU|nr:hypothetical protein NQ318_003936 [Aromia moschata]